MSRLENACKDIITRMVNGESVELSRDDRERLAAWAVKIAMVAEHTIDGEPFWRPEERRAFAELPHTPPRDTQIVTAHNAGGRYRAVLVPGGHQMRRLSGEVLAVPAITTCIVVGNLVLQVMADRYHEVTGRVGWEWPNPGFDRTVLLWPPGDIGTSPWPPAGTDPFDDESLRQFLYGRKATE